MARLIAIGGMSGSGKTSLAGALQKEIPNSVHLDSDRTRKALFGVDATEHLPPEAYSAEATARVVAEMERRAEESLAAGKTVIVSATFLSPAARADEEKLAAEAGVIFTGIWLETNLATLFDRVAKRTGDASDATADIVKMQAGRDHGAIDWNVIDAGQPREDVVAAARAVIGAKQKTAKNDPRGPSLK